MHPLLDGPVAIGHLLRRAGFGPAADTWAPTRDRTFDEVLDELLAGLAAPSPADPEGFDPYAPGAIQGLWLERMRTGASPLAEKLALFWHGHFATSDAKIRDPRLMWMQYQLFRQHGGGRFRDLLLGVCQDVAMVRWLDGNANRAGHPNENFARELQELFTLGIGHYTETDIREIARAFTGWGSRHHEFVFSAEFHDTGGKTIHGKTADFGGQEVVELLASLPRCATFLCTKLLRFFSHADPSPTEVDAISKVFLATGGDITAVLRAIFRAPAFRSARALRCLVKSPVEFCVGALRATGGDEVPGWMHGALDRMGQILFRPPSVKGWTSGTAWLSSGALVERLRVAARLSASSADAAPTIVSVAFQGQVAAPLSAALEQVTGAARVQLALASPEFQLA